MRDTIKKQIEDLLKKRKDSLVRIREISEAVRLKATEVAKLRYDFGLRKSENERSLKKRVEELELRISTENLPLKVEREIAEEIAVLEKRISAIKEIEKKKSKIGTLEIDIKKMKEEREMLKKEVDTDINEVESLRQEMKLATEREEGQFDDFCLGDLVTVKKENGKKSDN